MDRLLELTPREFEDMVATYLTSRGFEQVQPIGGAGDLGVDILCRDEHGRLVAVQCKRYKQDAKIGSPEIQHFYGMVVHRNASRGIFVTTSSYTQPARRLADETDIELIDGTQLVSYIAELERQQPEAELARQAEQARQAKLKRFELEQLQRAEEYKTNLQLEAQRAVFKRHERAAQSARAAADSALASKPISIASPIEETRSAQSEEGCSGILAVSGVIVIIIGELYLLLVLTGVV